MGSAFRPEATVGTLALRGDLDCALVGSIDRALAPLERVDTAILSFTEVTFCDSTVLSAIVRLRKRMIALGGRGEIKIAGPSTVVRHVLELCGFGRLFTVCSTMDEAMDSLPTGSKVIYSGAVSGHVMIGLLQEGLHPLQGYVA